MSTQWFRVWNEEGTKWQIGSRSYMAVQCNISSFINIQMYNLLSYQNDHKTLHIVVSNQDQLYMYSHARQQPNQ